MRPPTLEQLVERQLRSGRSVDWPGCLSVDMSAGSPLVTGTRIFPGDLVRRFAAGESVGELTESLHLSDLHVLDILIYAATEEREHSFPPVVRIDWRGCDAVERVLGRMSGIPVMKATRMGADSVVENFIAGSTIEEIAGDFGLDRDRVEEVIAFALRKTLDNAGPGNLKLAS